MIDHAKHTKAALTDLLDLKQKFANLEEARSAHVQSDEAAKQGRTLMVFTIVTIVFLPLSFMSAFFAIQIKEEFPWIDVADGRLSLAWVSKYMFPVSLDFSSIFVFFALEIDLIQGLFDRAKRKKLGESANNETTTVKIRNSTHEDVNTNTKNSHNSPKNEGLPVERSRTPVENSRPIGDTDKAITGNKQMRATNEAVTGHRSHWLHRGQTRLVHEEDGHAQTDD